MLPSPPILLSLTFHCWRFRILDLYPMRNSRPRRREAACRQRLSNTLDQSQNDQQDNRADKSVDDRGNNTAADYYADLRQQPASDQAAENANDDVAYQPVATAFDHHTGKPASDGTDNQPNDECLYVHFSPDFCSPGKGLCLHSFFIADSSTDHGGGKRRAGMYVSTARKHHFVMGITECMTAQPDYVASENCGG